MFHYTLLLYTCQLSIQLLCYCTTYTVCTQTMIVQYILVGNVQILLVLMNCLLAQFGVCVRTTKVSSLTLDWLISTALSFLCFRPSSMTLCSEHNKHVIDGKESKIIYQQQKMAKECYNTHSLLLSTAHNRESHRD